MARYPCRSKAITLRQAKTISCALEHAARLGFMPNQFLTIQWRLTRHNDAPCLGVHRILERLRKFLGRRCLPDVCIWVRERERPQTEHVHIALFLPSQFVPELEAALARWLEAEEPRAIDLRPAFNARRLVLGYFLKGGNKAVREAYDVPSPKRASPHQGTIEGKRVGTSRMLGAKAIAAYFEDGKPQLLGPPATPRHQEHRVSQPIRARA